MTFTFQDKTFDYFDHEYNRTAVNERRIEVPIVRWYAEKRLAGLRLLEVGNVLSHYGDIGWDVVDKDEQLEKGERVFNLSIGDFKPEKKYDALISISTFEHFGSESEIRAILTNLKENVLVEDAPMVITIPVGYNRNLERIILEKTTPFERWYWMMRDAENLWQDIYYDIAITAEYDKPYGAAGTIMIATSNL